MTTDTIVIVISSVITMLLTGIAGIIWWNFRRMAERQDKTNETLMLISKELGDLRGTVQAVEQWKDGHEKSDDERHEDSVRDRDAIWGTVNKLRDAAINQGGA